MCRRLDAARKILGMALGMCPKEKLFRTYIDIELQLGNIDRCRTLYTKYLEWNPASCTAWSKFAELETSLGDPCSPPPHLPSPCRQWTEKKQVKLPTIRPTHSHTSTDTHTLTHTHTHVNIYAYTGIYTLAHACGHIYTCRNIHTSTQTKFHSHTTHILIHQTHATHTHTPMHTQYTQIQ
jgi:hypothetical protein